MTDGFRQKVVNISGQMLFHLCKDGTSVSVVDGVPEHAEYVTAGYHPQKDQVYLIVESDEFDVVKEAGEREAIIPELEEI